MTIESDDRVALFKTLPVFYTMRSNLAMVNAFLRRSIIEPRNYKGEDLGFLGIGPGEGQLDIHNRSVTLITVALLYQCLENYLDLRRIDSRLEDPSLETFFKSLGSRRKFFDGMKTVRNGVFHVRSLRSWRSRNIRFFGEICDECGGILTVMSELHRLLYDFTGKVFSGELRIWPDFIYEDWDRLERERPELIGKLETGNVDILEVIDAMDSWAHPL